MSMTDPDTLIKDCAWRVENGRNRNSTPPKQIDGRSLTQKILINLVVFVIKAAEGDLFDAMMFVGQKKSYFLHSNFCRPIFRETVNACAYVGKGDTTQMVGIGKF